MNLLFVHIVLGTIGLLCGVVAAVSKKGSLIHRAGGIGFLSLMGLSVSFGIVEAFLIPERITVIGGTYSVYLMFSGWLAIKQDLFGVRYLEILLTIIGATLSISALYYAYTAFKNAHGLLDGFGTETYLFFGIMSLSTAVADWLWIDKPNVLRHQRLTRHLWRMCTALLLVEASVFMGQADIFPQVLQQSGALTAPLLLIAVIMVYWLIRLQWLRRTKKA